MKPLLIYSPYTINIINPNFYSLLAAATKITAECEVLLIGNNLEEIAKSISQLEPVSRVLCLNSLVELENLLPEKIAPALVEIVKNYTHILIASDSFGRNLLPRVAGMLEIGQFSDIVNIISPTIFERFMYTGSILAKLESLEQLNLLTIRTSNFIPYKIKKANQEVAAIVKLDLNLDENYEGTEIVKYDFIDKSIDLSHAEIVVSGGSSLKSKEQFDLLIGGLAKKINAAIGASKAAVDEGLVSNDCQVGQTGKVVAPKLYLAIGISGALQHISGMKNSKVVVAINNDSQAPIFDHADYGFIGDLFEIVPKLIDKL